MILSNLITLNNLEEIEAKDIEMKIKMINNDFTSFKASVGTTIDPDFSSTANDTILFSIRFAISFNV